jgi:hypothetical protein
MHCSVGAMAQTADPDLKVDEIRGQELKEPEYVAEKPLYGIALIGNEKTTTVWMVLDKSEQDAESFDTLYADLNGDGDLTEANERFTVEEDAFNLPDFIDPHSKQTHTDFKLSMSARRGTQMIKLLWNGEHAFAGGYPVDPDDNYMNFAEAKLDAPIVRFNGDGPFRFQHWISGEFRIGEEDDLKVFLGNLGAGKNSFCSFSGHVLPAGEYVNATLIYRDQDGIEKELAYELRERC